MLRITKIGLFFVVNAILTGVPSLHAGESAFSVIPKCNLTTGSRLFAFPYSSDELKRASATSLEDFVGFGLEFQYKIPETNIALGLSTDYIRTTASSVRRISALGFIPVEDGYKVIPIEFTGYFLIPVSGPTWGVYMGGGAGAYFGRRIYKYANVEAVTTSQGYGYGIHVLGGLTYRCMEWLSVLVEMKFRDLQFETTNAFPRLQTSYNGTIVSLQQPGASRIQTDGIVFQFGASLNF